MCVSISYDKLEAFKDRLLYNANNTNHNNNHNNARFCCLRSRVIFLTYFSLMLFVLRYLIMKSAAYLCPLYFMLVFAFLTQTHLLGINKSNACVFDIAIWTLFSCINSGASSYQIINCLMHFVKVTSRSMNK